jgi:hypothetical protein
MAGLVEFDFFTQRECALNIRQLNKPAKCIFLRTKKSGGIKLVGIESCGPMAMDLSHESDLR